MASERTDWLGDWSDPVTDNDLLTLANLQTMPIHTVIPLAWVRFGPYTLAECRSTTVKDLIGVLKRISLSVPAEERLMYADVVRVRLRTGHPDFAPPASGSGYTGTMSIAALVVLFSPMEKLPLLEIVVSDRVAATATFVCRRAPENPNIVLLDYHVAPHRLNSQEIRVRMLIVPDEIPAMLERWLGMIGHGQASAVNVRVADNDATIRKIFNIIAHYHLVKHLPDAVKTYGWPLRKEEPWPDAS